MPRRVLQGVVTSAKNDKTITVRVESKKMHEKYKKYVKSSAKYRAHDENNTCEEGQQVQIIECPPISKNKRWTLVTEQAAKKASK